MDFKKSSLSRVASSFLFAWDLMYGGAVGGGSFFRKNLLKTKNGIASEQPKVSPVTVFSGWFTKTELLRFFGDGIICFSLIV